MEGCAAVAVRPVSYWPRGRGRLLRGSGDGAAPASKRRRKRLHPRARGSRGCIVVAAAGRRGRDGFSGSSQLARAHWAPKARRLQGSGAPSLCGNIPGGQSRRQVWRKGVAAPGSAGIVPAARQGRMPRWRRDGATSAAPLPAAPSHAQTPRGSVPGGVSWRSCGNVVDTVSTSPWSVPRDRVEGVAAAPDGPAFGVSFREVRQGPERLTERIKRPPGSGRSGGPFRLGLEGRITPFVVVAVRIPDSA